MIRRWCVQAALVLVLSLPSSGVAAAAAPLSNADQALEALAKDLADQSRPLAQRIDVVRTMGSWATAQIRAPLIATLKDPAPELRTAAAQALGWPGNREAVPALRERVEMPGEIAGVKAAAIQSLGTIAEPSTRPLVVAATQSEYAIVRQAALWAVGLGPLGEPGARTPYMIRLASDQAYDAVLRCDAIRALTDVNEDRVVDALMQVLEREPRIPMALPPANLTQPEIMELRYAQARDVAAWAAEVLGQLRAKRAQPLLLKTADDTSDYFLRLMSLRALIGLGVAPEARSVFLGRLEDPLGENRALALVGLGQLGDRTTLGPVLTRLGDGDPLVRAQAVTTVAVLGDASARPALEALNRKESDSNVQSALEAALAHLPR